MAEGSWGVGGPEHFAALSGMHKKEKAAHARLRKLALKRLKALKAKTGAKKHKARKSSSRSAKAKMAHVRSFIGKRKGHRKHKKSGHRAHVSKAHPAIAARYRSLKSAYHAAGLQLFKSRHGGQTPKEWSKKHRKAKHKRSR